MFSLHGRNGASHCDGLSRREVLRVGALGVGGLTLPGLLGMEHAAHASPATAFPSQRRRARSVIMLFLSGGPSHLDMWDLKPDAPEEIRGTFRPIDTAVPGLRIAEHMPHMARQADKYSVLRSVCHATGNHPAASYWMMVGSPIGRGVVQASTMSREDRPHPGAALARFYPPATNVPAWVMVPEAISPVGPERPGQHAGFLGAACDPYRVNSDPNSADYNPGYLGPAADVSRARLDTRRQLLGQVSAHARHLEQTAVAQVLDPYYTRAFDLLSSPSAQRAFDVAAEPERTRDRYGRHTFGQSVLLAGDWWKRGSVWCT